MFYKLDEAIIKINKLGEHSVPFLFILDFELQNILIIEESKLEHSGIHFDIDGFKCQGGIKINGELKKLEPKPLNYKSYKSGFDIVQDHIHHGNSYLLNLTFRTEISPDIDLAQVYAHSKARYKLLIEDSFVVFSPETFIKIKEDQIFSYPMKGTMDASVPDAERILLHDKKELAEHFTIVDLIRNDLNSVAENVKVDRFRYVETIHTNHLSLLQTSSQISGKLRPDWKKDLGKILLEILPAGSVSGAPKSKTLEIIAEAEIGKRGFYTGVFGFFNGEELDSGVMIRFIEKDKDKVFFRSGGGITSRSDCKMEYQELLNKIYVPIA